jgi:hypothetical protein
VEDEVVHSAVVAESAEALSEAEAERTQKTATPTEKAVVKMVRAEEKILTRAIAIQ